MLTEYIQKKLKYGSLTVFASAICCGLLVGFVTTFSIVLSTISGNLVLNKLIYGAAFSALLLLIVLNGYELFTGNTMLLTVVHKRENTKKVLMNLLCVYSGNLIGCAACAIIIRFAGVHESFSLNAALLKILHVKTEMGIAKMLLLGVLANYFVCMGVYLSAKAKNVVETYLSLFFPICIFCLLGFEHSIANMFSLIYAAIVCGGSVGGIILNLFFVTIGNIIGGVLFAFTTKVKGSVSKTSPNPADVNTSDTAK